MYLLKMVNMKLHTSNLFNFIDNIDVCQFDLDNYGVVFSVQVYYVAQ